MICGDQQAPERPALGGGPDEPAYVQDYFVEQFRALRAKIEYLADKHSLKTIAVTSSIVGEGKTLVSSNLAAHLTAGGKKKVLLIDIDLRKPNVADILRVAPSPGLGELLTDGASARDIVQPSGIGGLYVIAGGRKSDNPDLLVGDKFRALLKILKENFRFIVLDTPPILPVADTLSIKGNLDGVIFVYRIGFTPYTMLRQAVEEMQGGRILGVVLNGVKWNQNIYQRYYSYRDLGSEGKEQEAMKRILIR